MVWKLFNASPNTSPFCKLSFKVTLMRPFIIFQYSANSSHHFQIHHASSPFTPAPRTVTSAAMALGTCIFQYRVPADAQGINFSSAMLQHVLIFPCSIGHLVFLRPSNMIFLWNGPTTTRGQILPDSFNSTGQGRSDCIFRVQNHTCPLPAGWFTKE